MRDFQHFKCINNYKRKCTALWRRWKSLTVLHKGFIYNSKRLSTFQNASHNKIMIIKYNIHQWYFKTRYFLIHIFKYKTVKRSILDDCYIFHVYSGSSTRTYFRINSPIMSNSGVKTFPQTSTVITLPTFQSYIILIRKQKARSKTK